MTDDRRRNEVRCFRPKIPVVLSEAKDLAVVVAVTAGRVIRQERRYL